MSLKRFQYHLKKSDATQNEQTFHHSSLNRLLNFYSESMNTFQNEFSVHNSTHLLRLPHVCDTMQVTMILNTVGLFGIDSVTLNNPLSGKSSQQWDRLKAPPRRSSYTIDAGTRSYLRTYLEDFELFFLFPKFKW